jgi:hypothetical protein
MAVEELEKKASKIMELLTRSREYRAVDETIRRYLDEMGVVQDCMEELDRRMQNYDIVDFIGSNMIETGKIDLEMVNTALRDIESAEAQFASDGAEEYIARSSSARDKMLRAGMARAAEAVEGSMERLMSDSAFVEFVARLDGRSRGRVQMMVLRSRKVECERKKLYFTRNKNFLYRSMVFQELMIYLKLFPSELQVMHEILKRPGPKAEEFILFESFSLSILKSYLHELGYKELVLLRDTLGRQLDQETGTGGEPSYDAIVDMLMFNAVGAYIGSIGEPSGSSDVVEI